MDFVTCSLVLGLWARGNVKEMGKKGGWISALKKAFTSSPREKPTNVQLVAQYTQQQHRGGARDKKRWGFGRSRQHAEPAPAGALISIPLYREPSSVEKILVDAEMEQQHRQGRAQYQFTPAAALLPGPPPPLSARGRERYRDDDDKPALVLPLPPPSPPPLIRRFDHDREQQQRLQQQIQPSRAETEWRQPQRHARGRAARPRAVPPDRARAAAVAIQSAFRGHMARRNYRSLRGLIRLQGVVRGPSVRRQTTHAMRCMQMLVRVQTQVRASRVEAMERRNRHRLRDGARGRAVSQDGGIWDDSLLSRDEVDARMKRKVDAAMKRERALAYSYSHQLLKATPMAAHAILADLQSGRSPWWWTPIERRREPEAHRHVEHIGNGKSRQLASLAVAHREMGAATPARSVASSYSKARATRPVKMASSYGGGSICDNESLTSCPAFGGVPNYMTPTLSASAKAMARAELLLRQQQQQQQAMAQEKPRFSFGLGQSIGSWAKSPFWKAGGQQSSSSRVAVAGGGRHRSTRSVSGLSVDSTVSMPIGIIRRPFK
ncbi:hypothetical protein GUJ93_ZPchr0007g3763 [Zizania palustris]|uniref:DUF4005 domain-containing protein n=1 Tax=Zizania palustris TaxID=103762 RepID=A0A8J5VYE9_ZIZPA|nr:hypothetical protein GUJ93_ZPchr0007g3763 [Zizania palustris]